jgi:hypothetical protein
MPDDVGVAVGFGVAAGLGLDVCVGFLVGTGIGFTVGLGVCVGSGDSVDWGVMVASGVLVLIVGVGVGVGVGATVESGDWVRNSSIGCSTEVVGVATIAVTDVLIFGFSWVTLSQPVMDKSTRQSRIAKLRFFIGFIIMSSWFGLAPIMAGIGNRFKSIN